MTNQSQPTNNEGEQSFEELTCPFCKESEFDAIGLANHLYYRDCKHYGSALEKNLCLRAFSNAETDGEIILSLKSRLAESKDSLDLAVADAHDFELSAIDLEKQLRAAEAEITLLKADLEMLKERLIWFETNSGLERYKKELHAANSKISKLTTAGDEMADYLEALSKAMERVKAWHEAKKG